MSTQLRNNPMKVALASMVGTAIEFLIIISMRLPLY